MKVVLDTNVLISGMFWHGDSNKILKLSQKNKFKLITSKEIIEEFIRVMSDFKIQIPHDVIKGWLSLIIKSSILLNSIQNEIHRIFDEPQTKAYGFIRGMLFV